MAITKANQERITQEYQQIPRIAWSEFYLGWNWGLDEHVTIVGPVGSGKTTLIVNILDKHPRVALIATKPRDRVLDDLVEKRGFRRVSVFPSGMPNKQNAPESKLLIWPPFKKVDSTIFQENSIRQSLSRMFVQGDWTIIVDEVRYLADTLHLSKQMVTIWTQGRSLDVILCAGTQRPARVPVEMFSEPIHAFLFANRDKSALERIRELGGLIDPQLIEYSVDKLSGHEVLYVNRVTGAMAITIAPKIK